MGRRGGGWREVGVVGGGRGGRMNCEMYWGDT